MSRRKRGLLGRKRSNRAASPPPAPTSETPEVEHVRMVLRALAQSPLAPPVEATLFANTLVPPPLPETPEPVADRPEASPEPPEASPEPPAPAPAPSAQEEVVFSQPEAARRTLAPGDLLGQWKIESYLGRLQGCRLFRAYHKNTERIRVVLKVLCHDPQTHPNLIREGELLFALKHPGVASVRNLKLSHVPPYLEMDELPGERLDVLLQHSQIFMAQALDLVEQLLGALVYLHARDVFHRDIQPANIMVRQNGVLTLMGFAYSADSTSTDPPPLTALGYLLPEWPVVQDRAQADLYATGCLLYELLTGRDPFNAPRTGNPITTGGALHRKSQLAYLDPGDRFHEDLRAVVRMLTSAEARGRFPSAATALGRLQRVERSYAT